jgi:hypothetical protein
VAITLIGTAQTGVAPNGGDVTLTFDGSPAENDMALVIGGIGTTDAGDTVGPSTAGYTQLAFEDWTAAENLAFGVWYKFMGATPDTDVICQGSGEVADGTAYVSYMLRGVDTSTPEDAAEVMDAGSGTNPDLEAITTATDGAWVFATYARAHQTAGTGGPSGYSGFAAAGGQNETNECSVVAAYIEVASASSEDPGTFTDARSEVWKGYTIAIRPSTGVGKFINASLLSNQTLKGPRLASSRLLSASKV